MFERGPGVRAPVIGGISPIALVAKPGQPPCANAATGRRVCAGSFEATEPRLAPFTATEPLASAVTHIHLPSG